MDSACELDISFKLSSSFIIHLRREMVYAPDVTLDLLCSDTEDPGSLFLAS